MTTVRAEPDVMARSVEPQLGFHKIQMSHLLD